NRGRASSSSRIASTAMWIRSSAIQAWLCTDMSASVFGCGVTRPGVAETVTFLLASSDKTEGTWLLRAKNFQLWISCVVFTSTTTPEGGSASLGGGSEEPLSDRAAFEGFWLGQTYVVGPRSRPCRSSGPPPSVRLRVWPP